MNGQWQMSTITPTVTVRAKPRAAANPREAGDGSGNNDAQLEFARGREALRRAINDYGVVRVPPGSHELHDMRNSGDFYDDKFYIWQFYLRRPLLEPAHLLFIARCFWSVYKQRYQRQPFQISGVEQAAIPILTAILMTAPSMGVNLHAFTVRKERKKFGLRNIIEGKPIPELPCVFVDDLSSPTHATLWHWLRTISEARLKFYPRAFVVVYKGKRVDLKEIPTTMGNIGLESIYTLDDFNMTYEEYQANKVLPR